MANINGTDFNDNGTIQAKILRAALTGTDNNDTLNINASLGSDIMKGLKGDDTYIVNSTGDQVVEAINQGIDTVQSSVTFTLGNNIENLTLTGSSSINGTGNSLANTIIGNSAANSLNGAGGNNVLNGGLGGDSYNVSAGADRIVIAKGDSAFQNSGKTILPTYDKITGFSSNDTIDLGVSGVNDINVMGNSALNTAGTDFGTIGGYKISNGFITLTTNAGTAISISAANAVDAYRFVVANVAPSHVEQAAVLNVAGHHILMQPHVGGSVETIDILGNITSLSASQIF